MSRYIFRTPESERFVLIITKGISEVTVRNDVGTLPEINEGTIVIPFDTSIWELNVTEFKAQVAHLIERVKHGWEPSDCYISKEAYAAIITLCKKCGDHTMEWCSDVTDEVRVNIPVLNIGDY